MKKSLATLSLLLFLALPGLAWAQGAAGQAGEFLRTGVGPKALGMGRAFTGVADDASALYWNPAGMGALSTIGGTFMFVHIPTTEDASLNYLAGAIPLTLFFTNSESHSPWVKAVQELKLGLGVLWHSLGEFPFYDEEGRSVTNPSASTISQSAVYLSAAYPLTDLVGRIPAGGVLRYLRGELEMGLTAKLIRQDLFGSGGGATSLDLGFRYAHYSGFFQLGLVLRDVNEPNLGYTDPVAGDRIPSVGMLGLALTPKFGRLRGLVLSFDYGFNRPARRKRDVMFGLEYDLSKLDARLPVKIRLGSNANYESFTVGLNFSPEVMVGRDWFPYGDLTYAKQRGRLGALDTEFALSVDRNPFTARYWYRRGMLEFSTQGLAGESKARRFFGNALKAKNPGRHAYRYDAALRLADLDFLAARWEAIRARSGSQPLAETRRQAMARVSRNYSERALNYLYEDVGKAEVDLRPYLDSFGYYVQSLILAGEAGKAVTALADSGRGWGKKRNVFAELAEADGAGSGRMRLTYLYAYALYEHGAYEEAGQLIETHLAAYPLARFLAAHMAFLEGDYARVTALLQDLDLNETRFPEGVFVPLTADETFGDELLFLKAASQYRQTDGGDLQACLREFAKIPRFFPGSDLSRFLTKGPDLLSNLIDYYEQNETEKLEALLDRIIQSYITAFSGGALREEAYTVSYK